MAANVLIRTADDASSSSEDEDEQLAKERVPLEKCTSLTGEIIYALE